MRVLVTGANRGIGHELVRQLVERGDDVDAVSRTPQEIIYEDKAADSRIRLFRCDIADDASVRALAAELGDAAIDIVINNAGVGGGSHQSVRDLDFAEALRTYNVDALGALRVSLALLPHVQRGEVKKLVHVTSGLGSIGDNKSGGHYAYRMAKAALNMMAKNLAMDLRGDGITSIVVNPGWVQTDMGGNHAAITPAESVRGMLRVIESATLAESGQFLDWKGGRYPY
ncbi:MAG TPA: SDR family oxidoreductase [Kofleriaceae bacterium]|jgi:NAD(P)-dependent dehydrogenase (short-subunit alcohol dehydrogenase family)|nr:SDR family oxidoreductase [Kofleriaceae bacterium]